MKLRTLRRKEMTTTMTEIATAHDVTTVPRRKLRRALADLAAEIYRLPAGRLSEHARLRAEAMEIRDTKAEQGGVTEDDWRRIDELLHASWRALHAAVNSDRGTPASD
jgi:hypothetical protein